MLNSNQVVRHFHAQDDDYLAQRIEDYARSNNLYIHSISYALGTTYGHVIVVFIKDMYGT